MTIIFEDKGRENEINEAKSKPYDGITVYEITEDDFYITKFLGNELKPYRKKDRDGNIRVGTTICNQYSIEIKNSTHQVYEHVELPDEWLQKESEQRWEAEMFDFKTERARKYWSGR